MNKRYSKFLVVMLMALAVPLTVYVAGQQQDLRQRAQEEKKPLAPYITIVSPADNAVVSGATSINVALLNNDQVTQVEYYIDGKLLGTMTKPPFNYYWNTVDSIVDGEHVITVRAT